MAVEYPGYSHVVRVCPKNAQKINHRYLLEVSLNSSQPQKKCYDCVFIGFNPSAANLTHSDLTVNRCIDLARQLGWKYIAICNICSYYDSNPKRFGLDWTKQHKNNLRVIKYATRRAGKIIAFWGGNARRLGLAHRKDLHDILCHREIFTSEVSSNTKYPYHFSPRQRRHMISAQFKRFRLNNNSRLMLV